MKTQMTKDYSKSKIYAIRSYQTDQIYVGSTIQELSSRMSGHRRAYRRFLNGKGLYITSFELVKFNDAYIELIENYSCSCKNELEKKEGEIIRKTENCVNKIIVGRTQSEYIQDNLEKFTKYQIEYRKNNKDILSEKKKEYYQKRKTYLSQKITCECGSTVRRNGMYEHITTKKHLGHIKTKNI